MAGKMKPEKVFALDREFYMNCFRRKPIVLEKGKGCFVFDSQGKKYLDFVGALATCSVGYSNPAVTKAICIQAKKLVNATNYYYTGPQALLAEKLAKISGLQKVFLSNSGTEAMEAAFKLARKCTGKTQIISTENAFHGRTFGALTATWNKDYKSMFEPLVPGFKTVAFNDAKALEGAIDENTAAFVVEPIQGESGINVPHENYLKAVAGICKAKGVLLILDEVQTGCGRTGKFFAFQLSGIKPDIVVTAKGLANGFPIGATISREGLDFEPGQHGGTFGGNPLACSAALATIKEIESKKLAAGAEKKGRLFMQKLSGLQKKFSFVSDVRGKGLMVAVQLSGVSAKAVAGKCLAKGLLVNSIGDNVLRFLPPLTVSEKEILSAIKVLEKVFVECA
ncbi:MAG: aspartate aminotransferase family protein [Candidatus Diapherotrites archaeon]|nr:aspartate aminotransferase family protein [Candidatus Diapherotrites archaeon]